MTKPDISPEAVERAIGMCRLHGLHGTEATLRALSEAIQAEKQQNVDAEWNYDRAFAAMVTLHMVQDDLAHTIYKGSPSRGVVDRMATMLRNCADDVEKMRLSE